MDIYYRQTYICLIVFGFYIFRLEMHLRTHTYLSRVCVKDKNSFIRLANVINYQFEHSIPDSLHVEQNLLFFEGCNSKSNLDSKSVLLPL